MTNHSGRLVRFGLLIITLGAITSSCSGQPDEPRASTADGPRASTDATTSPVDASDDASAQSQSPHQLEEATTVPEGTGGSVAASLESALTTDPVSVASEHSDFTEEEREIGVPRGSEIEVDADTWMVNQTGTGGLIVITVTPPNGDSTPYLAVVQKEDSEWRVLGTMPMGEREP